MNNQKSSVQFLGDHPVYVDGFPKGCERSCEGSLHLYPRKFTEISLDELAFLKDKRVDVYRFLKVVNTPAAKKEAYAFPEQVEPAKVDTQPELVKEEPQEEAWTEKKIKKKGKGFEGV